MRGDAPCGQRDDPLRLDRSSRTETGDDRRRVWTTPGMPPGRPLIKDTRMATYLDIHDIPGVRAADVVGAHAADVRVQDDFGVTYRHYWVDEEAGKVFCLVDAPDRDTANRVHREAHGLVAQTLYEVTQGA
jgi:hypothetical protein